MEGWRRGVEMAFCRKKEEIKATQLRYCHFVRQSTWFTDGSNTKDVTEASIHGVRPVADFFVPTGKHPTVVFQAETTATLECCR